MIGKLILNDNIFLWIKGGEVLFYDSIGFKRVYLKNPVSQDIMSFCMSLSVENNLRSSPIPAIPEVQCFVNTLTSSGIGKIVTSDSIDFSLSPEPTITNDIEDMPEKTRMGFASKQNLTSYLRSLTIYLGGKSVSNNASQQYPYPINTDEELTLSSVWELISDTLSLCPHIKYEIVISDVNMEGLDEFLNAAMGVPIRFHLLSIARYESLARELFNKGFKVELIVDRMFHCCEIPIIEGIEYTLMIRNEDDLTYYKRLIETDSSMSANVIADNNLNFFKKNVYLSYDELVQLKRTKREIHIHEKVNPNFWGNLYVFPNGNVYPSPVPDNTEKLGTIHEPIMNLVTKEYCENHTWRKIRTNETCKNCVNQWLCPSLTVYDRIFGLENSCNVFNPKSQTVK